MKSIYPDQPAPELPRLALRPKEAATALGMSEKSLWSLTQPRGSLPCVRHGSRVCYYVHQLQAWADEELARQQRATEQQAGAEGGSE